MRYKPSFGISTLGFPNIEVYVTYVDETNTNNNGINHIKNLGLFLCSINTQRDVIVNRDPTLGANELLGTTQTFA